MTSASAQAQMRTLTDELAAQVDALRDAIDSNDGTTRQRLDDLQDTLIELLVLNGRTPVGP